ncbi:hypothetical protein ACFL3S_13740 [Gemmatimonadota bacterium]
MLNRNLKPIGLPLDSILHRDLKVRAALEGRTMTELLEEAVRDFLGKPRGQQTRAAEQEVE